jgi:hypothetical protein
MEKEIVILVTGVTRYTENGTAILVKRVKQPYVIIWYTQNKIVLFRQNTTIAYNHHHPSMPY